MLTWNTTWNLFHSSNPSPLIIALVLEELEKEICKIQRLRLSNGHSLTREKENTLRGYTLKRFLLYRKLAEMIDGNEINARGELENTTSSSGQH